MLISTNTQCVEGAASKVTYLLQNHHTRQTAEDGFKEKAFLYINGDMKGQYGAAEEDE